MLNKLLTRYLVLVGVLAHVAVLGALLMAPELVQKLRYKAQETVASRLSAVLPSSAEASAPAITWDEARGTLQHWTPATGDALADGQIQVDGHPVGSLKEAAAKLRDGSLLEIGSGIYTAPLVIRANKARVIGRGHVVFEGALAEGKATFVVKGNDTTLENIECRKVTARDGNGACVRLEGHNLTLEHVYFHSSQQGLLTGGKPGDVVIRHSFLERLGNGGRAHGIYQGGGTLAIDRSYVLGSKSEGHEVKSRAARTTITRSVIASLTGNDSRLIDISNGGLVSITDCTLQQGPNSANLDMIGYALEKSRHKENSLVIQRNVIILERQGPNRLLHNAIKDLTPDVSDNIIVAPQATGYAASNLEYRNRKEAKLPPYPEVPDRPV